MDIALQEPRWDFAKTGLLELSSGEEIAIPYEALPIFKPEAWTADVVAQEFPELVEQHKKIIPFYSFEKWYDGWSLCYPYILSDRTLFVNRILGSTVLGDLSGTNFDGSFPLRKIIEVVERDGLRSTGHTINWEPGTRPAALFLCDDDYHWMRLDRLSENSLDFVWTHKMESRAPSIACTYDGTPVQDPREAIIDHESDYRFVSFFNVPNPASLSADVVRRENHRIWKCALLESERQAWSAGFSQGRGVNIPQNG